MSKKSKYGIRIGIGKNPYDPNMEMIKVELTKHEFNMLNRMNEDRKTLIISHIMRNLEKKGVLKF
tara:strand:+ start:223 stop:417 length:195 start_codon:yes stop_codon:yes gene_type:complete